MHFTAVITENAVVMIVPNVYMFMFQIEEHRICVCVRARPLNKKGESLLKVTFLINETPHSFFLEFIFSTFSLASFLVI